MMNITSIFENKTTGEDPHYDFKIVFVALTPIILGFTQILLNNFYHFLIPCIFTILTTKEGSQGRKMDNIASEGWCETRQVTPSLLPGRGMILIWIGRIPVIIVKGGNSSVGRGRRGERDEPSPQYTIYCPRCTNVRDEIIKLLMGRSDEINILWIESGNAFEFSLNSTKTIAPEPFNWQRSLSKEVRSNYERNSRASVLICGEPGLGKTSTCIAIALILKQQLKIDPIVVRGINLTQSGFTLGELNSPTPKKPVILVIDEIDAIIRYAEEQKERGEKFRSVAKDPSSLLGFLDRVNETNHYIIIMTSNLDVDNFVDRNSTYYRYARKGRIDNVYSVYGDPLEMKDVSLRKVS